VSSVSGFSGKAGAATWRPGNAGDAFGLGVGVGKKQIPFGNDKQKGTGKNGKRKEK
jgi:hypothetical protein